MSNSPKRKYDWDSHLPNMISLYFTEMSIPDICRTIQDEVTGFTPGYVNFRVRNKNNQVLHGSRLKIEITTQREPAANMFQVKYGV
jgi:hypothetical protein